jgi:hypothetical protein
MWREYLLFGIFLSQSFHMTNSFTCQLYLAPSLLPHAGFGIFSGVNHQISTFLRQEPTVLIDDLLLEEYQFSNYFYASRNGDYAVCAFGIAMMLNHLEIPNLHRSWSSDNYDHVQTIPLRPYTTYTEFEFVTSEQIQIGQELYTRYGSAQWFHDRQIPYDPSLGSGSHYTLNELQKVGHCLDNVRVSESLIPMAGRGLFANRNFQIGELVTLSPVLTAPLHQIRKEGASSLLINYCVTSPMSDFALLPIGYAAMANHGGRAANLRMEWYDTKEWNQFFNTSSRSSNLTDQESISHHTRDRIFEGINLSSILDSPSGSLYFGYYATREIVTGEELTIDYGLVWEMAYSRYLDTMSDWFKRNREAHLITAPQFRQPIQTSHDFYPKVMRKSCVGKGCSSLFSSTENDILSSVHQRLNKRSPSYQLNELTIRQSRQHLHRQQSPPPKTTSPSTCADNQESQENNWSLEMFSQKLKRFLGYPC